jgi:hypothetical protein
MVRLDLYVEFPLNVNLSELAGWLSIRKIISQSIAAGSFASSLVSGWKLV